MRFFKNKVFGLYIGRDWMRGNGGALVSIAIIPRRDLTREGELILCGLSATLYIGRRCSIELRSDADQIARKIQFLSNLGAF